jgi:hypothetical protein
MRHGAKTKAARDPQHCRFIQRKMTAEMPADLALPWQPPAEADQCQLPKAMNAENADKFRWFQA